MEKKRTPITLIKQIYISQTDKPFLTSSSFQYQIMQLDAKSIIGNGLSCGVFFLLLQNGILHFHNLATIKYTILLANQKVQQFEMLFLNVQDASYHFKWCFFSFSCPATQLSSNTQIVKISIALFVSQWVPSIHICITSIQYAYICFYKLKNYFLLIIQRYLLHIQNICVGNCKMVSKKYFLVATQPNFKLSYLEEMKEYFTKAPNISRSCISSQIFLFIGQCKSTSAMMTSAILQLKRAHMLTQFYRFH
eukprot:TRINITY_DN8279_c0_g1_i5.p1 TRINITY_DN8279_c0_g1~~TRINITY_DN8279_c0_g1_i5.p1  ORF type:complete len:271 (-),score=-14.58 TRINITY_DN8279_c0_g1_i5:119-868(-)